MSVDRFVLASATHRARPSGADPLGPHPRIPPVGVRLAAGPAGERHFPGVGRRRLLPVRPSLADRARRRAPAAGARPRGRGRRWTASAPESAVATRGPPRRPHAALVTDRRATDEYRRRLAGVLFARAVRRPSRAGGAPDDGRAASPDRERPDRSSSRGCPARSACSTRSAGGSASRERRKGAAPVGAARARSSSTAPPPQLPHACPRGRGRGGHDGRRDRRRPRSATRSRRRSGTPAPCSAGTARPGS